MLPIITQMFCVIIDLMGVVIVDRYNSAPPGFCTALNECLKYISFQVDTDVPIYIDRTNKETSGLAWNGTDLVDGEFRMIIKLFADDIDANVQFNRMNYWLFITLHEFAHLYYRGIDPQNAALDMEDQCSILAHEAIQRYKERTNK